jgi:3-methylcrotonyl-CoA carboxylase alpha subunit
MPSSEALSEAAMTMVPLSLQRGFRLNAPDRNTAVFQLNGERVEVALHGPGTPEPLSSTLLAEAGQVWRLAPWRAEGGGASAASSGAILSPMPGRIIAVEVAAGQNVVKGQKLVTLEAMKMEHSLVAPFDGVVAELNAETGGQVSEGMVLVKVEKES